ncbi:MAG TPA: hypothetical protein VHN14_04085 [Kofleriaceae bacterium]|nr:hypothetical protein [Kofleriaceae bacterium]
MGNELVDQRAQRRIVEQSRAGVAERLALDQALDVPRLGDLDQGLVAAEHEQGLAEAAGDGLELLHRGLALGLEQLDLPGLLLGEE